MIHLNSFALQFGITYDLLKAVFAEVFELPPPDEDDEIDFCDALILYAALLLKQEILETRYLMPLLRQIQGACQFIVDEPRDGLEPLKYILGVVDRRYVAWGDREDFYDTVYGSWIRTPAERPRRSVAYDIGLIYTTDILPRGRTDAPRPEEEQTPGETGEAPG